MKFECNSHGRAVLSGLFINSVAVFLLFVGGAVQSSTGQVSDSPDRTSLICTKRCAPLSNNGERQSHETCMLRCRNYIEETMFRPRVLESKSGSEDADTKSSGARRQARAAGGKNHMFVRVGKPYDSESENFDMEKRSPQMKGSFVRIGRQMSEQSAGDDSRLLDDFNSLGEADIAKRRSGFVRIGRIGRRGQIAIPPEKHFARIGRGDITDDIVNDVDDADLSNDKRGSKGQAFVRIGRKPANFVRIGRAFVRIGKKSDDSGLVPEVDGGSTLATGAEVSDGHDDEFKE